MSTPPGSTPVPDPTLLTTEAVARATETFLREIAALRELHDKDMGSLRAIIEARLDAMNERHVAGQDVAVRVRGEVEEKISHARELAAARFAALDQSLAARDKQADDRAAAASLALTTALASARELVETRAASTAEAAGKYEKSITAQLGQIAEVASLNRQQLEDKINAVKERLDRGEGASTGEHARATETRLNASTVIAAVSVLLFLISVVVTVIVATHKV